MAEVKACWMANVHSLTYGKLQCWSMFPTAQVPGFVPMPSPHFSAPVGKIGPATVQLSSGTGDVPLEVGNVTVALPIVPVPCVGTPAAEEKSAAVGLLTSSWMLTGTCQTGQLL